MKFLNFQNFIAAIIFLTAFGAGFSICAQSDAAKRVEIFDEVWNAINEKYYDANFNGVDWKAVAEKYRARLEKISDEKSFYILLDQMAGELRDSHTRIYSPDQREQRKKQTRARFGISIREIENVPVIASVAPDSEVARLDIKTGMQVLSVNGKPIKKVIANARRTVGVSSSAQAAEMRVFSNIVEGETNAELRISLLNEKGKEQNFTLKRFAVFVAPAASARTLSSGIAYLKFDQFDESIEAKINEHLKKLENAKALIIDLRGNSGGDGEMGLRFAGRFYDEKITVAKIITRTGKPPLDGMPVTLETVKNTDGAFTKPIAILIDERTASTAELITNALQETGRAKIFGANSCGCVLAFLDYKPLKHGGDLTLSEFGFLTPKNRRLEGAGITPDRKISLRLKDIRGDRDAVLIEAEKFLLENIRDR